MSDEIVFLDIDNTRGCSVRARLFEVLQRVVAQANAHRHDEEGIQVSPHVLRHTFLRKLTEEKGVHYAKEASGHRSDRYIWRYVKPDKQSLADGGIVALD
jgi:integrase/recombinase XerD